MKNKKYLIVALSLLLCAAVVLPFVFIDAGAEAVNFDEGNIGTGFKGKKISILGDSISTYEGVSGNGTSKYINNDAGTPIYYTENNEYGVTRADTWWQQAIDKLDMELCVNNAWSGSLVMGTDSTDYKCAWLNRCQQLHTASANPDFIAVYMGTNDIKNATSVMESFSANRDQMITEAGTNGNSTSTNVMPFSLYVRMVAKMLYKYSSAQIYLFTLLPNESQNDIQVAAMEQYNQNIRDLVTYYQSQGKKVYLVDLYAQTSITRDFEVLKKHLANNLHPNASGMDVITNCFLSSLVHNSRLATKPDNWKTVEYDLTDVYVSGGQINTIRISDSDDVPFSVSLLPTRSEYDLEVKVEALDNSDKWVDITSSVYSGSTVFVRRLAYSSYSKLKITAKAVYQPKNFRWETADSSFVSKLPDGIDYSISGTLTQNDPSLIYGSYNGTTFTDAQYHLSDTVLLRNEEPWVIEWKARGTLEKSLFLFSGDDEAASRCNHYIYLTGSKKLFIGYRNDYRKQYWNYGITIPSDQFTFDDDTAHVYRLVNQCNVDGSNMVYLYIDDIEIGAMNTYDISGTDQTGDLDKQNWLSGRDLEFSYIGAENFRLNHCSLEYLQVWEGGGFDTLRLEQLVNEYNNELKTTMADATGFSAYQSAVEAAAAYLSSTDKNRSQEQCDAHVKAVEQARNNLTKPAGTTDGKTKIYSVELINGGYVQVGMVAGIKVVTTPDVQRIQIGTENLPPLTNTSSIQTMKIDGEDTTVKVWLVSWKRTYTSAKDVSYYIHAATDSNAEITSKDDPDSKAYVRCTIPYVAKWITSIAITKAPAKTVYLEGEVFDPTGMELTAYYADGTSEVVTGYTYNTNGLYSEETGVVISYKDTTYGDNAVTAVQPVEVISSVIGLTSLFHDTKTQVYGYYVGVAEEGPNGDKEILLKDTRTDDIIAVRNFPGTFPEYGLNYGDELQISGTYKLDDDSNTPNKTYFQCDGSYTIRSTGNTVAYTLKNTVKVSSWAEMQELFQVGTIQEYTYIEFTGTFFINQHATDTNVYRFHMNDAATGSTQIKPDGTHTVTLRSNVMEKNLGADWLTLFNLEPTDKWRGDYSDKGLIALYTGAVSNYFQLTVLDSDWIGAE